MRRARSVKRLTAQRRQQHCPVGKTMTRHWHRILKRILRWLKPSAESFAAAAAVYVPDLMLQLEATRRGGAVPAPPSCHEVHFGDLTHAFGQRWPAASDRVGWQDGSVGDWEGARRCPAR